MLLMMKRAPEKGQKRVCIVRYGAWGDAIICSPVFKAWHDKGWHVTLNCTEKCHEVLEHDPYIDAFVLQYTNEIPIEKLESHWDKMKKQFDKVINLTESIEANLILSPRQDEYWQDSEIIAKRCNVNYYDYTMELAGFPNRKGEKGRIYFTAQETDWAETFRKRHPGFLVLWCLTGSAIHKIYPYAENVIKAIVEGIPEATVVLVGEPGCKGLVEEHPRIIDKCGEITIRHSCILTKYSNLVVATDTSVLMAAGCFPTPKIALLSHTSEENVTKYYENCHVVREKVSCAPCFKLHYGRETCKLDKTLNHPICMSLLHPKKLLPPIEEVYKTWKNKQLNGD